MRAPNTPVSTWAVAAEGFAEALVQRFGNFGPCRVGEARSIPLAFAIGDERELADDERGAVHVDDAAVELPFVVLEIRRRATLPASRSATASSSSDATPRSTQSPRPISATCSPPTSTCATLTRWTTTRIREALALELGQRPAVVPALGPEKLARR